MNLVQTSRIEEDSLIGDRKISNLFFEINPLLDPFHRINYCRALFYVGNKKRNCLERNIKLKDKIFGDNKSQNLENSELNKTSILPIKNTKNILSTRQKGNSNNFIRSKSAYYIDLVNKRYKVLDVNNNALLNNKKIKNDFPLKKKNTRENSFYSVDSNLITKSELSCFFTTAMKGPINNKFKITNSNKKIRTTSSFIPNPFKKTSTTTDFKINNTTSLFDDEFTYKLGMKSKYTQFPFKNKINKKITSKTFTKLRKSKIGNTSLI